MTAPAHPHSQEAADLILADLIEQFTARVEAGEAVDVDAFVAEHPDQAERLRRLLPGVQVLAALKVSDDAEAGAAETPAPLGEGTLGDFRIIREVGRGGMGVVYEAEQVSLRRRVALKVLPYAGVLDPRHLQRFRNEAQAAACLHHTNIVPVHAVGAERGVHYYAMQFIDGQTLAALIQQSRQPASQAPEEPTTAYHQPQRPAAAADTESPTRRLTQSGTGSKRGREYYRRVAELGVQAAEALDHAHQMGIVHRDVKPGNLLLDNAGRLWVTDFGLAHIQHGDASLTLTGDLVGTLRYMSPEQALAKRVPIDHRTDVYSLGATLYELLTLRPACDGKDRQELLRQIAFEEPAKPRKLDRGIPAELETIVLKALEKNPQDRYATAQEVADDLRRWLDERPIQARRPSWLQVTRKWARRHKPLVGAVAVVLVLVALLGGGGGLWWLHKRAAAEGVARALLQEATRLQQEEKWSEALSATRRAELCRQVEELGKDLEMILRLEAARFQLTAVKDGHYDREGCNEAYAAAFAWYGLDVKHGDAGSAAELIRSRSIRMQLVAALDSWPRLQRAMGGREWRHVLAVARAADADAWRNRLRDAWEGGDAKAINELLASAAGDMVPPATLTLLGDAEGVSREQVVTLLRRAQQRHPADFWINHELAAVLELAQSQREEAIRHHMIAVALRPQNPMAHSILGYALWEKGQVDEAIAEYREAIRLAPGFGEAEDYGPYVNAPNTHVNLGVALQSKGQVDEAITEYREAIQKAIRLKKDHPMAHHNLGTALARKGLLDEAIAEYREAIRLNEDFALAHHNLGTALQSKGQADEAIAEFREAIRIEPGFLLAHNDLGVALLVKDRLEEAIAEFREAIRIKPDFFNAHANLGSALGKKGRVDEAIAEFREAIRLKPDCAAPLGNDLSATGRFEEAIAVFREGIQLDPRNAAFHNDLGNALRDKGRLDEAITEFREAIRLNKDLPQPHNNLGLALQDKGRLDEAITEFREAVRLKRDYVKALSHLGVALLGQGRFEEAIAAFREAMRLTKDDTEQFMAACRYNVACAAARAGTAPVTDTFRAEDAKRVSWRRQALDWLGADLDGWRRLLDKEPDKARPLVLRVMQHWLADTDFAAVRGAEALKRLPEAERPDWQRLWEEVEALRQRAAAAAQPGAPVQP